MARVWNWRENICEFDPETGAFISMLLNVFAGAPRFPGDPTNLPHLKQFCAEDGSPLTFLMNDIPYATEADLITAYNETVIERLQLEPTPS